MQFQSTYPFKVRRIPWEVDIDKVNFQSTHPHRVRRAAAPAHIMAEPIFKSTLLWRSDKLAMLFVKYLFQSTYPQRVRTCLWLMNCHYFIFQSTHPRGMRSKNMMRLTVPFFNPRTHIGYENGIFLNPSRPSSFNPRTRVGYDNVHSISRKDNRSFNPRTRIGCDFKRSSF